jgi:DNA-binding Xre family transcriptional regulator
MMSDNPYVGSYFDDFLEENQILDETSLIAIKRVIVWQIEQEMEKRKLSKQAMAKQMKTSRSSLDRLLNPENPSVTLETIDRAARVLGKRVRIELVEA